MRLSESQKAKVIRALHQHDSKQGCYFWKPPSNASGRRQEEKHNTWSVKFTNNGTEYRYDSVVECSCANYCYVGSFYVNGEKKNRRAFADLLR